MPRKPRWTGHKAIKMDPNYPEYFRQGGNEGYRFAYNGPYRALLAAKPADGDQVKDFPGYYIGDLAIKPLGQGLDGAGVMTVTATSVVGGGTSTPEDQTVTEIDSGRLEKSIFQHERFAGISVENVRILKKGIEEHTPLDELALVAPVPTSVPELYELLLRGQDTYIVSAPVVRITKTSSAFSGVDPVGVGTRTTDKPHPDAPDGLVWLTTASRATQTGRRGKWEKVTEKSGADEWTEIIYGEQPGD